MTMTEQTTPTPEEAIARIVDRRAWALLDDCLEVAARVRRIEPDISQERADIMASARTVAEAAVQPSLEIARQIIALRSQQEGEGEPVAWRCFQCGEVFTNARRAALHFTGNVSYPPACVRQLQASERGVQDQIAQLEARAHRLYVQKRALEDAVGDGVVVAAAYAEAERILADQPAHVALRSTSQEEGGWRPEVRAFADLMEAQLRANDHKPGWKNDDFFDLFERIGEESAELSAALHRHAKRLSWGDGWVMEDTVPRVGREAADVANFAMMIADVCGALRIAPSPPPASPAPTDEEDVFGAPERWLEPGVLDPEGGADVWVWLTGQTNLELSFQYPDMEGEPGAWMVHRVTGNHNDREWDQVGCGATALEAVQAARANLPTEGGGK